MGKIDTPTEVPNNSNIDGSVEKLRQENQELREQRLCKVCMDAEVGVLFLPCAHLVTCPRRE